MSVKLMLIFFVMFLCALSSPAQSPVQEVGDEKEPELRKELVLMVTEDQNTRGEFDRFRKEHGLMVDNKTLNEKLNSDPALKEGFLAIANRMQQGDEKRTRRLKEIVEKYGWAGRTLVGTEAAACAWMIAQHSDWNVVVQRQLLNEMKKMPPCEVEPTNLAELTDRVLNNESKNQFYGTSARRENGKLVPKPIEDEANVDKRRAELGLQPLAEYYRRLNRKY
jgi:hypothetical protein